MKRKLGFIIFVITALCVAVKVYAAVSVTVNGTAHTIPQTNEKGWGSNVTAWIQAISLHTLQKSGGTFTLTADTDFGASYGLKSDKFKSRATNISSVGILRLGNDESIGWRNAANSADMLLKVDSSNNLKYNGILLSTSTGPSFQDSLLTIFDDADNTKIFKFQASGITTGTTRTLTVPDADLTLVGTATTQTLTNKTLTTPIISTISNTGTLTLPTSTDTLVGRATTDTLTNKTLTAPVIATISNTGTVTLPTATDTLVGRATTDTLTNKTISGGSNTISNISLTTGVTGVLPIANGGTNSSTSLNNNRVMQSSGSAVVEAAAITASRALISDANGIPTHSAVTSTTLGYLDATSSVQTQLDAKTAKATLTTKGDIYVATGASTVVRQAIGSDAQVLTADSAQTNGLKWATVASAPDQSYELSNVGLSVSVASNAMTIALKVKDGSTNCSSGDPCKIGFRSSTSTTGGYSQRTVTGALSVVVSSGSTLGHANATATYDYVYAIDNAGTVELAVSRSPFICDDGSVVTTTAEGGAGAADSNRVIYSTTARTGVACRMIGRVYSNQTTAGTWASSPTEVSLTPFEAENVVVTANAQNPTGSNAAIAKFGTLAKDPFNSYDTSTGIFTAPAAGYYCATVQIELSIATSAANQAAWVKIRKNSTSIGGGMYLVEGSTASTTAGINASVCTQLALGDTLDFYKDCNTSTNGVYATNVNGSNFAIWRVGK